MPTFVLKRIEFIEVNADNLEEARAKFEEGLGDVTHETEEVFNQDWIK